MIGTTSLNWLIFGRRQHTKPKVLLTFYFGASGLPLGHSCADGFRQLGWDVCCVDTHQESAFFRRVVRPYNKLAKALGLKPWMVQPQDQPWAPLPYRCMQLQRAVGQFRPDVVLVLNPFPKLYPTSFLLQLRDSYRFKLIGWNVDGPYDDLIEKSKYDAPQFDRYFCIHRHGYSPTDPIHYLPAYALDAKRYYQLPDAQPSKRGVVFVGAWSPRREEFLKAIADLPLEIYGTNWRRKGSPETRRCVKANRIWGDDLIRLMNESRIVLNLSSWPPEKGGSSLRLIDIPACGAFLLNDESAELRQVFEGEATIPAFTDPADLRAKVIHFLAAEDERKHLAARMYARIQAFDTYAERMRQLVTL